MTNKHQSEILSEVIAERQAQDAEHGGPDYDDCHSPNDWCAILIRHLGLSCSDRAETDFRRYRRQMVRVAALAVAAVEAHDRVCGGQEKAAGVDSSKFSEF